MIGRSTALAIALALPVSLVAQQRDARVVTLGGAVTEITVALGFAPQIVAIDRSSTVPAGSGAPLQLDYFRAVSAEGILAARPTLVLAADGSGPPPALAQLRAAGIRLEVLPPTENVDEAMVRIRSIARALGVGPAGDSVVMRVAGDIRRATAIAARAPNAPKVLGIYARGQGTLFVAGRSTSIDGMIALANGRNAARMLDGYRPLTAEAVIMVAPDYIVIPARGLESIGGIAGLLKLPGIAQTPAGRAGRIVAVDDHLLLGFGVHVADGIRLLAAGLHPELATELARGRP